MYTNQFVALSFYEIDLISNEKVQVQRNETKILKKITKLNLKSQCFNFGVKRNKGRE